MATPSVAQAGHEKPKARRGRPVAPAIAATEGLVEAIVSIENDARLLDDIAHALNEVVRLCRLRSTRLRQTILPELTTGYEAAESMTHAGAA